jgi:hypothetical protein
VGAVCYGVGYAVGYYTHKKWKEWKLLILVKKLQLFL